MRRAFLNFLLFAAMVGSTGGLNRSALGQDAAGESYRVYTDRPRLFLRPQRLRLLRRERERNSLRWEQFQATMAAGVPPEPGFANALYYKVSDDKIAGRRAVDWALGPDRDARQLALVYDWCQDLLTDSEKRKLLAMLVVAARQDGDTIHSLRDRTLAAIAIAGEDGGLSETALRAVVESGWRGRIVPELKSLALKSGVQAIRGEDTYALLEFFHALRDNLNFDLREDDPAFFKELPIFDLLSYYPPPWPAPENEYRIPYSARTGEPDLTVAALSRAGELAMVAYDTNAPETQVLQGWLMNDHFLMRGGFGIPYEFLWANPYQPGLSYYHVPLVMHDDVSGRLLVRSSWEDDAAWAGFLDGRLQQFRDGRVTAIDVAMQAQPIDLEEAMLLFPSQSKRFQTGAREANDLFFLGLDRRTPYHVEIDDEEMTEYDTDPSGILYLKGVRPKTGVRIARQASQP